MPYIPLSLKRQSEDESILETNDDYAALTAEERLRIAYLADQEIANLSVVHGEFDYRTDNHDNPSNIFKAIVTLGSYVDSLVGETVYGEFGGDLGTLEYNYSVTGYYRDHPQTGVDVRTIQLTDKLQLTPVNAEEPVRIQWNILPRNV